MNRIYILLLSVLIISCTDKEIDFKNLVERNGVMFEVNTDDPYNGKTFELYENQQFKFKGTYDEGLKNGTWEQFLENGQLVKLENYDSGKLDGLYQEYNDKNILLLSATYMDSLLDGDYKKYDINGKLKEEGLYKKGLKENEWNYYYDEKLSKNSNYKNGKLEGLETQYLSENNGNHYKYVENNFSNGQLHGISKSFDREGNVTQQTNYNNGLKDGLEEIFNSSGTKLSEIVFEADQIKKQKAWTKDGNLSFDGTYPGICTWYEKDGSKKAEGYFNNPNDLKLSSLKLWLNGKPFNYEILKNYRWEWVGKGKKNFHGYGQFYHHFNNFDGKDFYRLELLTKNRWTQTYNHGRFNININRLPEIVIDVNPSKSSYRYDSFLIKSWDGKKLKVNNDTWLAREKDSK